MPGMTFVPSIIILSDFDMKLIPPIQYDSPPSYEATNDRANAIKQLELLLDVAAKANEVKAQADACKEI
jgi:hypothetical protein